MDSEFTKIKFPLFVGRIPQLKKIRQFVSRKGTVVINIAGAGGVGKTAILHQIYRDFKQDSDKQITEIIDFSHTVHRVESWILDQISEINPAGFKTFKAMLQDVEKAVDPLSRLQRENEARAAFVADYNTLANQYRVILLFDTLELVQETPLLEFILTLVKQLKNTVLVLAGRNNDKNDLPLQLEQTFGDKNVHSFRLMGFDDTESHEYFSKAEMPYSSAVNEDLRQNISLLSDGNPIKIALSLDWLDRGVKEMVELTQMPVSDLASKSEQEIAEYKNKFEYAIMDGVRSLQKPINEVILYMAHFNKRFNRELVIFFFPDEDPDMLIAGLKLLPFVKFTSNDYFVLHDEMARMVQSFVWDTIEDPDKTLRRKLSEDICKYYQSKLDSYKPWAECSEQEKIAQCSYEVEAVYYRLYADFYSGYKYFEALYEKLVNDRRSGLAGLVVNFLHEFAESSNYSALLKCFVNGYYSGGILISEQKFAEAEKKLAPAMKQLDSILAGLDGKGSSPLDQYLRDRKYLPYQQLGFCYRSMGNWDSAKIYFQLSLKATLELLSKLEHGISSVSEKQMELIGQAAETLNSLANIQRLVGDYPNALLLCQTGTLLRKAWNLDTVMSQYVMAMTFWEMGATAEAVTSLRHAENECSDENKRAVIKKYRAYILFRAGFHNQALSMLAEAEAVFRQTENLSELVDSLNIRSRLYREIDSLETGNAQDGHTYWDEAKILGEEAEKLAVQIGDRFRQAESHLTQAILYYQWSKIKAQKTTEYRKRALEHWQAGSKLVEDRYYQLGSLYNQLRADIAFDEKNYPLAFKYYIEQCKISTHFKYAAYERSIDHVGDRLRFLGSQNPDMAKRYIDEIISDWQKEPALANLFPELISELQEVKKATDENEKIQEMKAQHEQAMLEGRWDDATEYLNKTLEIPSLYQDANSAGLTLMKSQVKHREENLSEARRLAKVVLHVGNELKDERLIGRANLVLTSILWDATSTAEAAGHLRNAQRIFQHLNDQVGLSKVKRYLNYFKYRTGIFENVLADLGNVSAVFEKHSLLADAADVKNIMSRIARTNPAQSDFAMADQFAQQALATALLSKDNYRIAECYVSLAILAQREQRYSDVLKFYDRGMARLPAQAHSMRTVYEGIRGSALFEQGLNAADPVNRRALLDKAFESFGKELIQSSQAKPASMARTTSLIFEAFMKIPTEDDVSRYTKQVEQQVALAAKDAPWANNLQIVQNLCSSIGQYYPYIHAKTG